MLTHAGLGRVSFNTALLAQHGRGHHDGHVHVVPSGVVLEPVPTYTEVVVVEHATPVSVVGTAPYASVVTYDDNKV